MTEMVLCDPCSYAAGSGGPIYHRAPACHGDGDARAYTWGAYYEDAEGWAVRHAIGVVAYCVTSAFAERITALLNADADRAAPSASEAVSDDEVETACRAFYSQSDDGELGWDTFREESKVRLRGHMRRALASRYTASDAVTDEEVRAALKEFMARGDVSEAAFQFHGAWMRRALEQFAASRHTPTGAVTDDLHTALGVLIGAWERGEGCALEMQRVVDVFRGRPTPTGREDGCNG